MTTPMTLLTLLTPAGVVPSAPPLRLAVKRLRGLGFDAQLDESALARQQRFGGADEVRLAALHRVAQAVPSIAMATRGGYGMTRLLDHVNWKLIGRSISQGTRWVGYSDLTALQMGLIAKLGEGGGSRTWAGPMAVDDFSRTDDAGGVDEVTRDCFVEAMGGELEAVGWRTEAGFDGVAVRGTLWGGNLTVLCALLGTPHMPPIKGGILFLEDVNEHPYRVERHLLQLHQAGVLATQKAVVLGAFSAWKPSPLDRGFTMKTVVSHLRSLIKAPVITGLPFGHVHPKVCLPVGAKVQLLVDGRDVLMGW
jgi:muramoyltetrapeptide carboxypeptidase